MLEEWHQRQHGGLSFRTVQVLTGHGCFGEYLHEKAGRESSTRCHHCTADRDTAQHTLESCPAWDDRRRVLIDSIGADLTLTAVVKAMLESEEKWNATASFCEEVLTQKEAAEREREEDPEAEPIRRRRGGARRRAFARAD